MTKKKTVKSKVKNKSKSVKKSSNLIFIDTNIILDFYRVPEGASFNNELLDHIDNNHNKIITSDQVQMEYKKNRQRIILEALNNLKNPDWGKIQVPAFLHGAQATVTLKRGRKNIDAKIKTLKVKIEKVLTDPQKHDPVYQTFQRLFNANSKFNLSRKDNVRNSIRHLARKRFILGYPPRKERDLTIGDAVNWEWLIHCAQIEKEKNNVVIVSRDTDYGFRYNKKRYVNDWLALEFKERVSLKRKVSLTDKLSDAFGMADKPVSTKVAAEEQSFVESQFFPDGGLAFTPNIASDLIGLVKTSEYVDENFILNNQSLQFEVPFLRQQLQMDAANLSDQALKDRYFKSGQD